MRPRYVFPLSSRGRQVQLGDELELAVAQLRAGEVSLLRLEGEAETEAEGDAAGRERSGGGQ